MLSLSSSTGRPLGADPLLPARDAVDGSFNRHVSAMDAGAARRPRFRGVTHTNGNDNRSRHREVSLSGSWHRCGGHAQHGLLRSLKAAELSDGTLRYLLLISALLSPRPPTLMILNEPETSLHQDLLAPLARLVAGAASRSQIFVVTHASPLADSLLAEADCRLFVLGKELGETRIADVERPTWTWPTR